MEGIDVKFKDGDYVKIEGYKGIAFVVLGPSELEPDSSWFICDHEYDSYCGYCTGEFSDFEEFEPRFSDSVYDCVMVGDDMVHKIDEEYISILPSSEFCHGCGQIGCNWHTMEE